MRLGDDGAEWVMELIEYAGQSPELLTEWQQDFLASYGGKVSQYDGETFVSEPQLVQLNKIAEACGVQSLTEDDLDA